METIHPLFVHFPIALLITAMALEVLGLVGRSEACRRAALWNLVLGVTGALGAVVTGRIAAATAKHSFEIHQVMTQHERAGYLVLSLAATTLAWRLATRSWQQPWVRWVGAGLLAAACAVLASGAHLGGRLVYEYGVGGSYGRSSGGIEVIHEH